MGPAASQNVGVPMRQECMNFESRTYANGETVQKCNIDLAPDAPWRCPDQCSGYQRRIIDGGWTYGSLTPPSTPEEPPGLDNGTAAAVLDEAEEIINAIVPEVLAEVRDYDPQDTNRMLDGLRATFAAMMSRSAGRLMKCTIRASAIRLAVCT